MYNIICLLLCRQWTYCLLLFNEIGKWKIWYNDGKDTICGIIKINKYITYYRIRYNHKMGWKNEKRWRVGCWLLFGGLVVQPKTQQQYNVAQCRGEIIAGWRRWVTTTIESDTILRAGRSRKPSSNTIYTTALYIPTYLYNIIYYDCKYIKRKPVGPHYDFRTIYIILYMLLLIFIILYYKIIHGCTLYVYTYKMIHYNLTYGVYKNNISRLLAVSHRKHQKFKRI